MFSCGHNGAISIDATFDINDIKFHFFILMCFDIHHTSVPLAEIIMNY
jgi:hypothetical protein